MNNLHAQQVSVASRSLRFLLSIGEFDDQLRPGSVASFYFPQHNIYSRKGVKSVSVFKANGPDTFAPARLVYKVEIDSAGNAVQEFNADDGTRFASTEFHFRATDTTALEVAVYKGRQTPMLKIDSVSQETYRFQAGDSTIVVRVRDARSYANGLYRNAQNEYYNERYLGKKVLVTNQEGNQVLEKMKRGVPVTFPNDSLYLRRHDYYCSFTCAVANSQPVSVGYDDLRQYHFIKPFRSRTTNYETSIFRYRDPHDGPVNVNYCGFSSARREEEDTWERHRYTTNDRGLYSCYYEYREDKKTHAHSHSQPLYYFQYDYYE